MSSSDAASSPLPSRGSSPGPGIEGASMRQVAAEAGWTTGTLVHYFADKREMLRFTLGESLDRRRAQRFDRESLAPRDAIRHTLANALPDHRRVDACTGSSRSRSPRRPTATPTSPRSNATPIASSVRTSLVCSSTTRRRSKPTEATAEAERLIALVDGVALQALFDPDSWPPERQLQALDIGLRVMA